jgi:hypothetical protein
MRAHKKSALRRAGGSLAALLAAACGSAAPRAVDPAAPPRCRPFWLCVQAADPHPRTPLNAPTGKALRLAIAPSVADRFAMTERDPMLRTEVWDWRRTLARGFESGFGAAFQLVGEDARADYVLRIATAYVSLVSVEIGAFQTLESARADLLYRAELLDADGRVLRTSGGTVASRSFRPASRDVTGGVAVAVAKMYEAIEKDCFAPFERLPQ